jgi:hypothetical protein
MDCDLLVVLNDLMVNYYLFNSDPTASSGFSIIKSHLVTLNSSSEDIEVSTFRNFLLVSWHEYSHEGMLVWKFDRSGTPARILMQHVHSPHLGLSYLWPSADFKELRVASMDLGHMRSFDFSLGAEHRLSDLGVIARGRSVGAAGGHGREPLAMVTGPVLKSFLFRNELAVFLAQDKHVVFVVRDGERLRLAATSFRWSAVLNVSFSPQVG